MSDPDGEPAFESLTPREREILRLVAKHLQSKEIARLLDLSPRTVEMHVLHARRRLQSPNRRDAALAFTTWEQERYGSDYRKHPNPLADTTESLPPELVHGDPDARRRDQQDEPLLPRKLVRARGGLNPSRGDAGTGASRPGNRLSASQGARDGGGAVEAAASHSMRHSLLGRWRRRSRFLTGGWRDDLSRTQWFAIVVAVAVLFGLFVPMLMIAAHNFLFALQRLREGWSPPL